MLYETAFLSALTRYGGEIIFVGAFFFGESVIITATMLATQGFWSLYEVSFFSFFGTVISDSVWFFFGQHFLKIKERLFRKKEKKEPQLSASLKKIFGQRPFLWLLVIKFLYGTRILTILYLSSQKMRFGVFTIFNSLGTMLWLAVIISIGVFAGQGLVNLYPQFQKTQYLMIIILVPVILFKILTSWISKHLKEK